MQKITILKGLPGSGKTTWAKEQVLKSNGSTKRINKDDLRSMLDAGKWSKDNESYILEIRNGLIAHALGSGKSVIVDDTNLDPKHVNSIKNSFGDRTEIEIKLFDVPVEECIARDAKRGEKTVGEKVIRDMYEKYMKPTPGTFPWDNKLPLAIICDIDGTLAHMKDRGPFDWHRVGEDGIDMAVDTLLTHFYTNQYKVLLVSGRDGICRSQTEKWLRDNSVLYHRLFMRPEGDNRKDTIIKKEILDREIRDKYNVLFVLDDRDQVVKMWRDEGLKCLQVAEGEF